jgi:hypothetical protein
MLKTLYRRWLIVGLSMSIFALTSLKRALEAQILRDREVENEPGSLADSATSPGPVLAKPVSATTVTFSGTVIRDGSRFALRETAGVLYILDSTGRAWPFEGESVRVTGYLDSTTSLLHVDDIKAMAS